VTLDVDIRADDTIVRATLAVRRNPAGPQAGAPLELHGDEVEFVSASLDGAMLRANQYAVSDEQLTIPDVPERFTLETVSRILPQKNSRLEGLYATRSGFATQCEAEGFRRITWFIDRPDVMATYRTTGARGQDPIPGAAVERQSGRVRRRAGGRHYATFDDPFPKPSYLFALVAARLEVLEDEFTTRSGAAKKAGGLRRAGQARPGRLGDGLPEARDALGRAALRARARSRPVQDRRGRRLQLRRDGEQGPQHLQREIRAGAARRRDRPGLRQHRPRGRARVFPQLDREPRHLPRLVPALAEGRADGISATRSTARTPIRAP
jgi:hypothetical protein